MLAFLSFPAMKFSGTSGKNRYSGRGLSGRLQSTRPFVVTTLLRTVLRSTPVWTEKRKRLKSGAVPTILHRPSTAQATSTSRADESGSSRKRTADAYPLVGDEGPSKRKRGAVEKRERREVDQSQ